MKKFSVIMVTLILLVGCGQDGFKKIDDKASYRILRFESDSLKLAQGDMCYMNIATFNSQGETIDVYPRTDYVFVSDTTSLYWTRYLNGFSKGDSVAFLFDGDLFNVHDPVEKVEMHIGIEWILPLNTNSMQERSSMEYSHIFQHIMERGIDPMECLFNSIYVMNLAPGTDKINWGDALILHSEIYLLNDSLIYSSVVENSPIYFNFGQEDQVVVGVETALTIMNYQSKSEFIIPSSQAFGEEGSQEIGIKPFTPVRMVLWAERQLSISQ